MALEPPGFVLAFHQDRDSIPKATSSGIPVTGGGWDHSDVVSLQRSLVIRTTSVAPDPFRVEAGTAIHRSRQASETGLSLRLQRRAAGCGMAEDQVAEAEEDRALEDTDAAHTEGLA